MRSVIHTSGIFEEEGRPESYIYFQGGAWHGPIVSPLAGYNDFEYVHGVLRGGKFVGIGQLLFGDYQATYHLEAAVVDLALGSALVPSSGMHLLHAKTAAEDASVSMLTSTDLHVEPDTGAVHAIAVAGNGARAPSGMAAYFYTPALGAGGLRAKAYLDNGKARFHDDGTRLSLIAAPRGRTATVEIFQRIGLRGTAMTTALAIPYLTVPYDATFGIPCGVFSEDVRYQRGKVQGFNIAVIGAYSFGGTTTNHADNLVRHFAITP